MITTARLTAGNGSVDFDEFLKMMSNKMSSNPEIELREVFDVFDTNSDGLISSAELHDVLVRLGESVNMVCNLDMPFILLYTLY